MQIRILVRHRQFFSPFFFLISIGAIAVLDLQPFPRISESCIEIKINLLLFAYFSVVPQKVFMKALKAFIKPIESPQRSVKI